MFSNSDDANHHYYLSNPARAACRCAGDGNFVKGRSLGKITSRDLEVLIALFQESDWKEMKLSYGEATLFLSKDQNALIAANRGVQGVAPAAAAPPAALPAASPPRSGPVASHAPSIYPDGWIVVRAPSLGTFYRAPKPGAAAFCDVGQVVEAGKELCLLEVMKLFTTVLAHGTGIIREIYPKDGEMVEFDQPLFLIEPDV